MMLMMVKHNNVDDDDKWKVKVQMEKNEMKSVKDSTDFVYWFGFCLSVTKTHSSWIEFTSSSFLKEQWFLKIKETTFFPF